LQRNDRYSPVSLGALGLSVWSRDELAARDKTDDDSVRPEDRTAAGTRRNLEADREIALVADVTEHINRQPAARPLGIDFSCRKTDGRQWRSTREQRDGGRVAEPQRHHSIHAAHTKQGDIVCNRSDAPPWIQLDLHDLAYFIGIAADNDRAANAGRIGPPLPQHGGDMRVGGEQTIGANRKRGAERRPV
jgi:hypothetical protein